MVHEDLSLSMHPGSDGREWTLEDDFHWLTSYGISIVVRKGFATDGASIPRVFWRLIGPPLAGTYAPAALVHDALYASKIVPRPMADRLFLKGMEELGVTWWKRNAMYLGVRLGGRSPWRSNSSPDSTCIDIFPSPEILELQMRVM